MRQSRWPLLVSPGVPTLTLGTRQFLGQFVSDWNAVLAALTIAIIPMLILYIIFNRQFVRGIWAGRSSSERARGEGVRGECT